MVMYSSDTLLVDTVLYETLCFPLRYVRGVLANVQQPVPGEEMKAVWSVAFAGFCGANALCPSSNHPCEVTWERVGKRCAVSSHQWEELVHTACVIEPLPSPDFLMGDRTAGSWDALCKCAKQRACENRERVLASERSFPEVT